MNQLDVLIILVFVYAMSFIVHAWSGYIVNVTKYAIIPLVLIYVAATVSVEVNSFFKALIEQIMIKWEESLIRNLDIKKLINDRF